MEDDDLRYDTWIEDALRDVIKRALNHTAANGLAGEHHFYITFNTQEEAVQIPGYLRAEHPDEMTIVLQHQFDSLIVTDEAFSVSLRFSGKPEYLHIPFSAITAFADPSVNFGLQLKMMSFNDDEAQEEKGFWLDNAEAAVDETEVEIDDGDEDLDEDTEETGKIIALDAFRKK
ncbi:MAG: hypothetical protein ISR52_09850 [Rhodospirillales bacterium]|nr:hypothetical protein [Rhodospirillales bacterium]